MTPDEYASIEREISEALTPLAAPDAMRRVVEILKARVPTYTWVGIYELVGEELVLVPVMRRGIVLGEIDIDSDVPAAFGPRDRQMLEAASALLAEKM